MAHHGHHTQQYSFTIPKANTQMLGSNSIKVKSIKDWNEFTKFTSAWNFFLNVQNLLHQTYEKYFP